jgi:hypothetical protein
MEQSWLICLYRILLNLYPRRFNAEFADEMESVFADLLSEAITLPRQELLKLLLLELWQLPGEAIRQHLKLKAERPTESEARQDGWEGPATRTEMLVGLGVFILPAVAIWIIDRIVLSRGFPGISALVAPLFWYGAFSSQLRVYFPMGSRSGSAFDHLSPGAGST